MANQQQPQDLGQANKSSKDFGTSSQNKNAAPAPGKNMEHSSVDQASSSKDKQNQGSLQKPDQKGSFGNKSEMGSSQGQRHQSGQAGMGNQASQTQAGSAGRGNQTSQSQKSNSGSQGHNKV